MVGCWDLKPFLNSRVGSSPAGLEPKNLQFCQDGGGPILGKRGGGKFGNPPNIKLILVCKMIKSA